MSNERLPPRARIRIYDSETGSYPTAVRTGDLDFFGNFNVRFDDTKTIIYSEETINYPSLLPVSSEFVSSVSSSINTTGIVIKGVSDRFVTNTSNNTSNDNLTPFDDSTHVIASGDSCGDDFCLTGSRIEDVGPGFSSRLLSKTSFSINVNPKVDYTAGIRNGAVVLKGPASQPGNWDFDGTTNHPMMYYNFALSKWEGIGRGLATSITGTQGYLYGNAPTASSDANLREGTYGFAPCTSITASLEGRQSAIPMSNFGFPSHPKFHATSSQLLDMSEYINAPFLLEKIVYEFSASYKPGSCNIHSTRSPIFLTNYTTYENSFSGSLSRITSFVNQSSSTGATLADWGSGEYGTPISTFFILNQRRPNFVNTSIKQERVASHDDIFGSKSTFSFTGNPDHIYPVPSASLGFSVPTGTQISPNGPNIYIDTFRDLVTFAQVSAFDTGTYTDENKEFFSRDLNIHFDRIQLRNGIFGTNPNMWSGRFIMSASVRAPVSNEATMPMFVGGNDTAVMYVAQNIPGARTGLGQTSGRDLVSSVVGNETTSSIIAFDEFSATTKSLTPGKRNSIISPYLLFPTDKIVLGWQVPFGKKMFSEGRTQVNVFPYFLRTGKAHELTMHHGAGKLIFYGSLIKENFEFHDTRNTPLTSLAIHEDIHPNIPVLDQFDTEPRFQFSGSYICDHITGNLNTNDEFDSSLLPFPDGNPPFFNRGVAAQRFSSEFIFPSTNALKKITQDPEGNYRFIPGFIRGVQLRSESERFYDSITPDISEIMRADGTELRLRYAFGAPTHATALIGAKGNLHPFANDTWPRAFPFEPRYSKASRLIGNNEILFARGDFDPNTFIRRPFTVRRVRSFFQSDLIIDPSDWTFNNFFSNAIISPEKSILDFFSIGETNFQTGSPGRYADDDSLTLFSNLLVGIKPRGFKYGIVNPLPTFSKAVFRYNSYGQFRDILEQRLDAKYFDVLGIKPDGTKGVTGARTSPVSIRFVEPRTIISTDPLKTYSSNLSIEATSSLPYFDGVVRNREEPINLSDLNTTVVSL